jgi:hypothetical protein
LPAQESRGDRVAFGPAVQPVALQAFERERRAFRDEGRAAQGFIKRLQFAAALLEDAQRVPLHAAPDGYTWAAGLAMFVFGAWFFRVTKRSFAEAL